MRKENVTKRWRWPTPLMSALEAGRANDARTVIEHMQPALRADHRIRLLEAQAALESGDPKRAAQILESGLEIPDVREGERLLETLWVRVFPGARSRCVTTFA
jgi:uncharacterized membrane-anchored protein